MRLVDSQVQATTLFSSELGNDYVKFSFFLSCVCDLLYSQRQMDLFYLFLS